MYLICVTFAFLLGGVFALLLRTEHLSGGVDDALFTGEQYNKLFTLHGAVMVFLFIIPGIPAAFGNFVMPIMLGTKDVAFPKLNLLSWYFWVFGCCFRKGSYCRLLPVVKHYSTGSVRPNADLRSLIPYALPWRQVEDKPNEY